MREGCHLRLVEPHERRCSVVRQSHQCDLIGGHEGQHVCWKWTDGLKVRQSAYAWTGLR